MTSIEKINTLLLQRGITGADLSRAIGLSNGTYSQWNTGATKPSKKTLKNVADYFGVNVLDLVDDPEKEKPATESDGQKEKFDELKFILNQLDADNSETLKEYALFLLQRQKSQGGQ